MKHLIRKTACLITVLAAFSLPVFSVDAYVSGLYQQIDAAFDAKSDNQLNSILSKSSNDVNYFLIENYTMKKIRHLVIDEEYQFALQANLIVIDNNLENTDAVDMYSTISSALEKQKVRNEAIAKQREIEQQKYIAEKEKRRNAAVKEYRTVSTSEGSSVYLRNKSDVLTSNYWNVHFGMFNGSIIKESDSNYDSFRYGINGDVIYEYSFDNISIGVDGSAEATILPLTNDDKTVLTNFYLAPKLGFNNISKNLFFRTGFAALMRSGNSDETTLQKSLYTPLFGVSFDHANLGPFSFAGSLDYYLGHFAHENLKTALGGEFNIGIPVSTMERVRVMLTLGVKDTLFVKESGMENRARIVLAIGAENVAK